MNKKMLLGNFFFLLGISALTAQAFAMPSPTYKDPATGIDRLMIRQIHMADYLKNISSNQIVEKMDSQGKGKPDIFIVYDKKENGGRVLSIQLFDLNRDGKIDLVKFYEKGKLVRTESDLDFDGSVDLVTEYDPINGSVKKKIQADSSTNIWTYFSKGEIKRKEIDRNFDGKPDMWVYYRNGKPYRTEVDQTFNGKIVRADNELLTPANLN